MGRKNFVQQRKDFLERPNGEEKVESKALRRG